MVGLPKKVPINSGCNSSPNGRHDWKNGEYTDEKGRRVIKSWCDHCGNMPK